MGNVVSKLITLSNQQKINDLILVMMVIDIQPFFMSEDVGFRKLIVQLEPST